jgi:hypothetical protein
LTATDNGLLHQFVGDIEAPGASNPTEHYSGISIPRRWQLSAESSRESPGCDAPHTLLGSWAMRHRRK